VLELLRRQQQDAVGGARIALDQGQAVIGLHEVERHLPRVAELSGEPLGDLERRASVDRDELDRGAVLPLARRPVLDVRGRAAAVKRRVGAAHRAVDELLDQPRGRLGRIDLVDGQMPCQRTGVGQQRDAAARERGAGEVAREAIDGLAKLCVVCARRPSAGSGARGARLASGTCPCRAGGRGPRTAPRRRSSAPKAAAAGSRGRTPPRTPGPRARSSALAQPPRRRR
jgi:hypothetical protein